MSLAEKPRVETSTSSDVDFSFELLRDMDQKNLFEHLKGASDEEIERRIHDLEQAIALASAQMGPDVSTTYYEAMLEEKEEASQLKLKLKKVLDARRKPPPPPEKPLHNLTAQEVRSAKARLKQEIESLRKTGENPDVSLLQQKLKKLTQREVEFKKTPAKVVEIKEGPNLSPEDYKRRVAQAFKDTGHEFTPEFEQSTAMSAERLRTAESTPEVVAEKPSLWSSARGWFASKFKV